MTIKNGKHENSAQRFLLGNFRAENETQLLLAQWSPCPISPRANSAVPGKNWLEPSKGKWLPGGKPAWFLHHLG